LSFSSPFTAIRPFASVRCGAAICPELVDAVEKRLVIFGEQ